MHSTSLRVSSEVRDKVSALRRQAHLSTNDLLARALEALERELFFDAMERGAAQASAEVLEAEEAERGLWERAERADGRG